MVNILSKMQTLAEERAERYRADIREKFFPLTDLETLTFLGSFSWANPARKTRYLDKSVILTLFDGITQTPPEVARDYLRSKYTEKRRHLKAQYAAINEPRSAPRYCRVGRYDDMVYVDVKSAYWSIMSAVGWDIDYYPSRWLGKRSDIDDFPVPDNKLARNSLVSAGLLTPSRIWTGESLKPFKSHNPLVNYDLWAFINDVLHALATIALTHGAVYINTDGYIVPRQNSDHLIYEVNRFGLQARIKGDGDAVVHAVGCYEIGDFRTKHKAHFRGQNLSAVYQPDIAWLRARVAKFANSHINW